MPKYLYHYTAAIHLPEILKDGFLKLTESNLSAKESLRKPVVWLTDVEIPDTHELGLESDFDKTEIRFTIKKAPYFKKWKDWSRKNNIEKAWAQALEKGRKANSWWISEITIKMDSIVKIENTKTGEVYFEQS